MKDDKEYSEEIGDPWVTELENIKKKLNAETPICPMHKIPMEWSELGGWGCKRCSPCPCVRAGGEK